MQPVKQVALLVEPCTGHIEAIRILKPPAPLLPTGHPLIKMRTRKNSLTK